MYMKEIVGDRFDISMVLNRREPHMMIYKYVVI